MSVTAVLDGSTTYDSGVDVGAVAQLSAVGALADEAVADLIKAEAGLLSTKDSHAITRAAELFASAVAAAEAPASLWAPTGLADALRKMSGPSGASSSQVMSEHRAGSLNWLRAVASALASAVGGEAARAELDLLRVDLGLLAAGTMDATQDALHSRLYSASWLTL